MSVSYDDAMAASSVPLATRIRDRLRKLAHAFRRAYFRHVWHMDLGPHVLVSFSAKLDKTNPRGVHVARETVLAFGSAVLTHDFVNGTDRDVHIGAYCFIGAHAIVLPGVTVGDHCIVAAASVVALDVPPGSLVAGNPARIVEHRLQTGRYGVRLEPKTRPT